MNQRYFYLAKAVIVASLAISASAAWAERPKNENPACSFTGGAYYKSNNTLYLESFAKEGAKVKYDANAASCLNENASDRLKVTIERSVALTQNSTLILPIAVRKSGQYTSSCVNMYDIYNFSKVNGKWIADGKNMQDKLSANRPALIVADTKSSKCKDIKEITFLAQSYNNNPAPAHDQNLELWLHDNNSNTQSFVFAGTYSYEEWKAGDGKIGKVYGYAARDKGAVTAGQFVKVGTGANIAPLRAYLRYRGHGLAKVSSDAVGEEDLPETIEVRLHDSDSTLSIGKLNTFTGELKMDDRRFDLKGRTIGEKPANWGMFLDNKRKIR
ncbi:MAG: hypothetical protein II892_04945 [Fibrobacter sp.]|nr:hypothetical protein [Fibrobacter sp.]